MILLLWTHFQDFWTLWRPCIHSFASFPWTIARSPIPLLYMDIHCLPSSSPSSFNHKTASKTCPTWSSTHTDHQNITTICFFKARMYDVALPFFLFLQFHFPPSVIWVSYLAKCSSSSMSYYNCGRHRLQWKKRGPLRKRYVIKAKKGFSELQEKPVEVSEKKGTIAGAVALIIGTSIGTGILALPNKASPAVSPFFIVPNNWIGSFVFCIY